MYPIAARAPANTSDLHDFAMALTDQDVQRIAHLAHLNWARLNAGHAAQLNGFFAIVEQMRAIDTRGVEPLYTPLSAIQEVALRLR